MVALNLNPLTVSGVIALVMQAHLQQFRRTGRTYLESFGSIRYQAGEVVFVPSQALKENASRMQSALAADRFCLDAIELKLHELEQAEQ